MPGEKSFSLPLEFPPTSKKLNRSTRGFLTCILEMVCYKKEEDNGLAMFLEGYLVEYSQINRLD